MGRHTQSSQTRPRTMNGPGLEKQGLIDELTIRHLTPTSIENSDQLDRFEAYEERLKQKRPRSIGRKALR